MRLVLGPEWKQWLVFWRRTLTTVCQITREEILSDFPKPDTPVLMAPKLDKDVEEQLRSKGKDPYYGQEKVLYKLQETLLDMSGPLMCLWAYFNNPQAEVSKKEILLLTQRALVLLGSASNTVSLERRKIVFSKINPNLKALVTEPYEKREDQLFGSSFLEKASKKMETQKALAKVSSEQASRKWAWNDDKADLHRFFYQEMPLKSTAAGISVTLSRTTSHTTNTGHHNRKGEVTLPGILRPNLAIELSRDTYKHTVTTSSRQSSPLLPQMGADNLRPLDTGGSKGVLPGVLPTLIPVPSIPHGGQVSCRPTMIEEIKSLIQKQAVVKTTPKQGQFVSRIFLVPKRDGSFHPVINLKPLNFFIRKCHFKMEGTEMLRDLPQPSSWMYGINLKDAYLSVSIRQEHRQYLRFTWMGSMYEFTCLPSGLTSTQGFSPSC